MKTVIVIDGLVVAFGVPGAGPSSISNATSYDVTDSTTVKLGWAVKVTDGVPTFAFPVAPISQAAQLAAIQAFRVRRLAASGKTLQALALQAGFNITA